MKVIHRYVASSVLIASTLLSASPDTYAQSTTDAPTIGEAEKGKVLMDNSHAQTAGAADWVLDGGFSDYANQIAKQGYQVKELRGQASITPEKLKDTKILVIPEANTPFKSSEQQAMVDFAKQGASIIFISDHYNADRNLNRIDSSEAMNGYRRGAYNDMTKDMSQDEKQSEAMQGVNSSDWLAENFGVRFRYNGLNNLTTKNMVTGKDAMGITDNVNSVSMHAGSTLAITDPDKAKGIIYTPEGLSSEQKWSHAVDQGVYAGGGKAEGPYVAVSKVGKGKAAFIGDSSLVEDSTPKYKREDSGDTKKTYDGFKEADNQQLLSNLTTWLGKQEDAETITALGVSKDQATPLKDFEQPKQSTEPQKEPWSEPKAGYKWYDPSTFAAGSYGGSQSETPKEEQPSSPDEDTSSTSINTNGIAFDVPEQLQAGQTFTIKIQFKGQPANQTLNDLRAGIYADGGRQLATFGTQSSPGYSAAQSVQTDSDGNATLSLKGQTISDASGSAHLRLKQGSHNLKTQSITIN
ncbi:DNA-binding protein [Mammaliicoccus lentus]|uniref:DNA-binding protein n=1 Tax=Mammaliicoccus lentus TaxID=42858 RepID=UPI0027F886C1|nr:DNA-binding protein [Mammaliicoccus lentus]MDQ7143888.1 DNA-binding protein [Mammaliicoccus lentus]